MSRSTSFVQALVLVSAIGFQAVSCVSPPVGGGPSAGARLESVISGSENRNPEDLARDVRELTLENASHVPTLIADAALSMETGRVERAAVLLETALRVEPDNVDAVLLATQLAARDGDLAGARRRVAAALRTRPDAPELHEASAALFYLEDRHAEALSALDQADALTGETSWRSEYHRGLIAEDRGELQKAEEHYSRCTELEPDYEPAARRLRWIAAQRAR